MTLRDVQTTVERALLWIIVLCGFKVGSEFFRYNQSLFMFAAGLSFMIGSVLLCGYLLSTRR